MKKIKKTNNKIKTAEISQDKYFYLNDGRCLRNLKELADVLKNMPENMFKYHVTKDKNDFVNWVKDVFGNKKLASDLMKMKTAKSAGKKIEASL